MDNTSVTVASYDACVPVYVQKFRDFPLYENSRGAFARLLNDGARILDLGCGPATVSAYLSKLGRGFRLEGCDLSAGMVAAARQEVPDGSFRVHDLREPLPFSGPYDGIIASFCIVHLDDTQTAKLLERIPPLCETGAVLLLSWIDGQGDSLESTSFGGNGKFWYCRHDGRTLAAQLKQSGWKILDDFRVDYPNPDGTFDVEGFIFARWTG
jgi:SAM-dependent methyltransferase